MLEGFEGSSHVLAHITVPRARPAIPIDLEYKWISSSISCEGRDEILLRRLVPWLPLPLLRTILWQFVQRRWPILTSDLDSSSSDALGHLFVVELAGFRVEANVRVAQAYLIHLGV